MFDKSNNFHDRDVQEDEYVIGLYREQEIQQNDKAEQETATGAVQGTLAETETINSSLNIGGTNEVEGNDNIEPSTPSATPTA